MILIFLLSCWAFASTSFEAPIERDRERKYKYINNFDIGLGILI